MDEARIRQDEMFSRLPAEWPEALLPAIQKRVRESARKIIVLDDDPTGTQTVHDIPVLTGWSVDQLIGALRAGAPAVYLLTNSRALPADAAGKLNETIGANLCAASRFTGQDFVVVSRSDSTLRGHFPAEVSALAESLAPGSPASDGFDAWLVVPFFIEGGRYTIDDVHWVAEGEWLTPAGQTEFARDKSFGYRSSNLREWVAEKTGTVSADQVASISISDLREGGPQHVTQKLLALPRGSICIVNAASYRDLEVLVLALLDAEAAGWRCLYRTAASFVRVRSGITPRSLLNAADLRLTDDGAGLVIAGSYVPKTTAQLETLLQDTDISPLEVQVKRLLDSTSRADEIERIRTAADENLREGRDTVIFTSRALVTAGDAASNLAIGQSISDGLVAVLQGLQTRPRYLLAKGGITSSDLATRGLGVAQALVLGQVLPGVPAWQTGPESRFPGLAYIVFPGNVGGADALAKVVKMLRSPTHEAESR